MYLPRVQAVIESGRIASRLIEKAMAAQGLSPAQYEILALAQRHQLVQPTQLAAALLQETHSVSGLLNRLEDRGFIERKRSNQDRRVVYVVLTRDGTAALTNASQAIMGQMRAIEQAIDGNGPEVVKAASGMIGLLPKELAAAHRQLAGMA